MKRLFFTNVLFICALSISAQMKVQPDGRIVVNPSPSLISTAQLAINNPLSTGIYVNTVSGFAGIQSYCNGLVTVSYAIPGEAYYSAGVIGKNSLLAGSSNTAVSIGVVGRGNGSTQGRNIGVVGSVTDVPTSAYPPPTIPNGAGIFGTVNFNSCARDLSKAYAGYFVGDVEITTQLKVNTTTYSSDYRYKQNITDLRQAETNKVFQLNPVKYNLKQRYTEYTDSTGNLVKLGEFDENSEIFQKKHYGLIAQEVRELYPDLVYEDGDGYLSVDYIGIIPLLIQSLKEQNSTINEMRTEINQLKNGSNTHFNAPASPQQETTSETVAVLFQNTPNPFNENTEIAFYLPQSVANAMLCVYDMNGKQLSQNIIAQRGNSVFVVNGSQYGAGMYLYSLIADNQIVDTKRMILTK